jgi:hypothetical protein
MAEPASAPRRSRVVVCRLRRTRLALALLLDAAVTADAPAAVEADVLAAADTTRFPVGRRPGVSEAAAAPFVAF